VLAAGVLLALLSAAPGLPAQTPEPAGEPPPAAEPAPNETGSIDAGPSSYMDPIAAASAPVDTGTEPAPAKSSEPSPMWGVWIFDLKLPILIALVVFSAMVLYLIRVARRKRELYIRPLAGITAIEEAVGRATEMGRPIIYVPGIDDVNNIQTIYSMVILEHVSKTVAQYGTPLIVPIGKAFVTPMAEETVKQGFLNAGVPDAYHPGIVRYLSDEQFAFTAATNGIILREKPAANLLMGSFYAESLMLAETGFMAKSIQVAGTANVHQLPFFVVACDYTLIGEEFFAATAYLSREPNLLGTIKAQDYFKVLILATLVIGFGTETLAQLAGVTWLSAFATWLSF
jgi:hypothetical protein